MEGKRVATIEKVLCSVLFFSPFFVFFYLVLHWTVILQKFKLFFPPVFFLVLMEGNKQTFIASFSCFVSVYFVILFICVWQSTRGRLLTIDEVKQVGAKDELLERAGVLEADSRGWFEEDEEFEARLNEVRQGGVLSPGLLTGHVDPTGGDLARRVGSRQDVFGMSRGASSRVIRIFLNLTGRNTLARPDPTEAIRPVRSPCHLRMVCSGVPSFKAIRCEPFREVNPSRSTKPRKLTC